MADEFDGKRVLITGAGRGIGHGIALAFGGRGARVAAAARSTHEIEAVAAEINGGGGTSIAVVCDVTSDESVATCVGAVTDAWGGVDILVNSAGIAPSVPLVKSSMEHWNGVLDTNLTGAFRLTRLVLPGMLERGWGRVIHLGSIASKSGMKYVTAYCASKHGVLGLVRAAAQEVAGTGVTVNAVCPGYVDSPMTTGNIERLSERTGRSVEEIRGHMARVSPQNRLIEVDEVSAAALYLASEGARGVTGQGLNVCGGSVMS